MAIELDTTSFAMAIERFSEGLDTLREQPDNRLFRDGVIQRFEFTYELAHKTLKRYLKMSGSTPAVFEGMVFQDLIRTGSEQGLLLSDWEVWKEYRQARTDSSHAYNEEKALLVINEIPAFLDEARFLLQQLRKRTEAA